MIRNAVCIQNNEREIQGDDNDDDDFHLRPAAYG
jgi:hypothetical protein